MGSLAAHPFQRPANEGPARYRLGTEAGTSPLVSLFGISGRITALPGCPCAFIGVSELHIIHKAEGETKRCSAGHTEKGKELLCTRSGLGGFLQSLRHPLPCKLRPISWGPRPGRGEAKPQRNPPLTLFCLWTSPWGWKAGLTQRHGLRTPLLFCHPAVRNRHSFPGAAAWARAECAAAEGVPRLEKWAARSLVLFNKRKCKVLLLVRNSPIQQ